MSHHSFACIAMTSHAISWTRETRSPEGRIGDSSVLCPQAEALSCIASNYHESSRSIMNYHCVSRLIMKQPKHPGTRLTPVLGPGKIYNNVGGMPAIAAGREKSLSPQISAIGATPPRTAAPTLRSSKPFRDIRRELCAVPTGRSDPVRPLPL